MKQVVVALFALVVATPALAQSGPAAPTGAETVSRDEQGHVTVRAIRLTSPLTLDGRLDEALYRDYAPASDFIQNDPKPDTPATEKTDVWVSFDRDNLYVTMRAWESEPSKMIANEMRRDNSNIRENENVGFTIDTFHDGRNSFIFSLNPLGGRSDGQNTNEGNYNADWNPVWEVKVARFEGGWVAETAVPFKSLRYQAGTTQVWGFNARRISRWKNEVSYLSRVPEGTRSDGLLRVSMAATLVGLEVPAGTRTLDLKPYGIADVTSDVRTRRDNDPSADFGFDGKYTVTQTLTGDFTYNTDFAQVESDDQQVNLTRFSLFFPEKREFFLENLGVFGFGGANQQQATEVPLLFYSRRIGLDAGSIVPIDAGGRITGRVGPYSIGLINMQTGEDATGHVDNANFSVARLQRDILRKSAVGVIYTHRTGQRENDVFGADAHWAFFDNLSFYTYLAKTKTPGREGHDYSSRLFMDYTGDRYGATVNRVGVGENFNPEIGYVKRYNSLRNLARLRFSPRPTKHFKAVRKFSYEGEVSTVENWRTGMLESRGQVGRFSTQFQNSDELLFEVENGYEAFKQPFAIAPEVTIPAGGYDLLTRRVAYTLGTQRPIAGKTMLEQGPFYGGKRTTLTYSTARVKVTPQVSVEPGFSINDVTLPYGDFTATVVNNRVTYNATPMMFVSGLLQYNSTAHSLSTNIRFRWEYRPASELFVVYNEGRDTNIGRFATMQNRSFVVKVNRLLRF